MTYTIQSRSEDRVDNLATVEAEDPIKAIESVTTNKPVFLVGAGSAFVNMSENTAWYAHPEGHPDLVLNPIGAVCRYPHHDHYGQDLGKCPEHDEPHLSGAFQCPVCPKCQSHLMVRCRICRKRLFECVC